MSVTAGVIVSIVGCVVLIVVVLLLIRIHEHKQTIAMQESHETFRRDFFSDLLLYHDHLDQLKGISPDKPLAILLRDTTEKSEGPIESLLLMFESGSINWEKANKLKSTLNEIRERHIKESWKLDGKEAAAALASSERA